MKLNRKARYAPYRQNRLKAGLLYQDFIVDLAWSQGLAIALYSSEEYQKGVGESRTGLEIKYDEKYAKTGNIYIETAEKAYPRDGDYFPSGIYANEKTWLYIIGDYDTVFIFLKQMLLRLHQSHRYREVENETKTSLGFLIPGEEAKKFTAVWYPKSHQKIKELILNVALMGKELHAIATQNPSQLTLFGGL